MSMKDALKLVREEMPEPNRFIAEGVPYHQANNVLNYVTRLLKVELDSDNDPRLPQGFRYVDCDILTPEEMYDERAKPAAKAKPKSTSKMQCYDMSQTDTFLVRLNFENGGKKFHKLMAMPFVRRGGIIHIKGTKYGISTVLKTRGISLTPRGFFVEFQSSKVNFEWITDTFMINGVSEHVYMPFSQSLHHKAKNCSRRYLPPLACWLFAQHGLHETFQKYLGMDIKVYNESDPALAELDTDEYAICRAGYQARGERPEFAVVVRKDELEQSPQAKIMIGTMFYIGRRFPARMIPENMEERTTWVLMLAFAIFGAKGHTEQRLIAEIENHFENIERMMDVDFQSELIAEEIEVSDIYEFIYFVIDNMTQRSGGDQADMANLWGRYFTVIEYLTYDIRHAIFNARWDLINLATDHAGRTSGLPVDTQKVQKVVSRYLSTDLINRINSKHGEVSAFMTTTDNMIVGLTSHCIDQTDARKNKGGGKKVIDLNDASKHLHSSIAEVGSLTNLPKSSPIGPGRMNIYAETNHRLRVVPKEKFKPLMRELQADICQKGI